jgi:4-amino-4-deoxy-L-arabinose transferase
MFEYFQSWQYSIVVAGLVFLTASVLAIKNEKNIVLSIVLLVAGAICLRWFAITLDSFLNIWDEQYHALVARNCMAHPLKPTLYEDPFYPFNYQSWIGNHVWLHKQPLFLWQIAISMKIFGVNEIAIRIPDFTMMVLSSLIIFRIGKIVSGVKTGLYAAVIFTTLFYSQQLISGYEVTDHNDVAFLFYVTASLWAWVEYESGKNKKWIYLIALFAACAVLNKWLTGLLVYGAWGITLLFFTKNPFTRKELSPLFFSLLTAFIIFLPWQIFISMEYPLESSWEKSVVYRHLFEALEGHSGNAWYHFDNISSLYNRFVPFIIIPAFVLFIRNSIIRKTAISLVSAVIIVYAVFTIAATKMPAFTFPVAGIVCLALGSLFVFLESALTRFSKGFYYLFVLVFISFFYFNLNMQTVEKGHGINKINPQKNHYVLKRTRDAAFYKNISGIFNLHQKPVVFNIPLANIPMFMFYTGATAYSNIPSSNDIKEIKKFGRDIYILTREVSTDFDNDSSIKVIRYPENIEVNRRKVALKFSNNKFLCYESYGNFNLVVNREWVGDWETFTLQQFSDSSFSILASNNTYLTVNIMGDQSVHFGPVLSQEWEHFKLLKLPNGKVNIKDCNNSFLFLKEDGLIHSGKKNYSKETEIEIVYLD